MRRTFVLITLAMIAVAAVGRAESDSLETVGLGALALWLGGLLLYWVLRSGRHRFQTDKARIARANRWNVWEKVRDAICPVCGYSLTGNVSGVCPECGANPDELLDNKTLDWFHASGDDPAMAMSRLGNMYARGKGVPQNHERALRWCLKAAEGGNIWAMSYVGSCYAQGRGVERDYQQAMNWCRKAADAGDATGLTGIGLLFYNGKGVAQDCERATDCFRKAADAGEPRAMAMIGLMYEQGNGVVASKNEAVAWYGKAAGLGDDLAKKRLAELGIQ